MDRRAPGRPGRWRGRPDRVGGERCAQAPTKRRLFVKAEHLQVTGSFKSRGAVNRVLRMTPDERSRGIVTLSAGNHAGAVAYAAAAAGIPVTVVMPLGASRAKAEAAKAYGATVELYGAHVGETFQRLEQLRSEQGALYIPPFDDPDVIAGQGTAGLEILADLPDVDVVVVGVGGGGLISGISAAVRQAKPSVRVYGVEPRRQRCPEPGPRCGRPGVASDRCRSRTGWVPRSPASGPSISAVDTSTRWCSWTTTVIADGMRFALGRMKQLLEPAGAAALGAAAGGCGAPPGRRCGVRHRVRRQRGPGPAADAAGRRSPWSQS